MANFRKSFNFRNGVQVDTDNFVVTPLGLVGIGTTVPTEFLDVRGTATVTGLVTSTDLYVSGISTLNQVTISGETVTAGVVTASYLYGDGSGLTNIPTSQWVDTDVGLGYTSIYSQGNVGVATTSPYHTLQVGSDPTVSGQYGVGISSSGDIYAAGIVTAKGFSVSGGVATFDNVKVTGVTTFGPGLAGGEGDVDFQHNGATRAYWDSSAGTLNFKDGDGITLGTDEDFSISFDGSNTYLTNRSNNSASDLYIQSDEILLRRYNGTQTMAQFTESGSCKLNYAGVTKIQTAQSGVIVSGDLSVSGVATVGVLTSTGAAVIDGMNINAKSSTNTHIGKQAGNALVGGQQNVALGMYALLNNTNSNFNTAIGMQALGALGSITSSAFDRNTALGSYCGAQLTTGSSNTFLGASAGSLITTGSQNTIVGRYDGNSQGLDIRTSDNNIILSDGDGNIRFFANSSGDVGINSTAPRAKLDVNGSLNVTGVSTFSNGNVKVGAGNSSAVLRFGDTIKTFDIINNETGNINMYLHNGDVGVSTGRFDWIYGQTNQELMSLNYDGKLGLGKTNPDNTLHVVGTSTVTGNAWFGGDVTISGTLNVDSLPLPSLITTSNILSSSGVSTFFDLDVTNNISIASSVGIGTSVPIVSLDAQNKTALFGTIGINTYTEPDVPLKVSGQSILDSVGIGTTSSLGEGLYLQGSSFVQRNATMSLYDSVAYIQGNGGIGIGTTAVRCQVDFADAGKDAAELNPGEGTGSRAYMLPPRLTNAQRAGLTTEAGAFIFNLDEAKFQGYTGVAWTDFH